MSRRRVVARVWRAGERVRHRPLVGPTEEVVPVELALDAFELMEQMRQAGCSDSERRAILLWLVHRSAREVANKMGLSRAQVIVFLTAARERLRQWRVTARRRITRGEVLAVYAQEVSRRGYSDERHCPPGEEECRTTGRCTRRWYLFREATL
ncbi:MAG: hypothetical protein N2512_03945 [Armatimonadetes bacterium]|nr:hypothetical protein [Armatimonadota bacterium]